MNEMARLKCSIHSKQLSPGLETPESGRLALRWNRVGAVRADGPGRTRHEADPGRDDRHYIRLVLSADDPSRGRHARRGAAFDDGVSTVPWSGRWCRSSTSDGCRELGEHHRGVVLVLVAVLIGGFAKPAGPSSPPALRFIGAVVDLGCGHLHHRPDGRVGFLIYCIDVLRATTQTGGLTGALAIKWLRGKDRPDLRVIARYRSVPSGIICSAVGMTIVMALLDPRSTAT